MDKKELRKNYERACNDYVYALMSQWEYDGMTDCGWVKNEPGEIYCFGEDFISMNDIILCVEREIDYETYQEYIEYETRCDHFGFNGMNLEAYVLGAPRVPEESFRRLEGMERDLYEAIQEAKEGLENNKEAN